MQEIKTKLPKLKPKERQFAKEFVLNGEEKAGEVVREVYGIEDDNYSRVKASRLITKDNVRQEIEIQKKSLKLALEEQGITTQKIAIKVDELLNNEDPNAIDKGLKHALAIHGVENPDDKPRTTNSYTFIFNEATQTKIKAIDATIKEQLLNDKTA